jgi:cytochrome oxidase Cu insertion factor (SCO1/SenC/PrrC family)
MHRWVVAACVCTAALFGQEFKLGSAVSDFAVKDVQGNPVQYSTLKGTVTVVSFIATQCPVSNAYNDRMKAIYSDYAPKGVKFVFLNSNRTEPAAEVARHAGEHAFPFAVYKDDGNVVADRFGATVTPESFVIDSAGVIRYHGSIDDSQNPQRVQTQRLRNALDAITAGRQPEQAETKAFGCTIKKAPKTS